MWYNFIKKFKAMPFTSYLKTCVRNTPGNQYQVFLAPVASITSITLTTGAVSAVTMTGGALFQRAQGKLDTVQYTSEGTMGNTLSIAQSLKLGFDKMTAALNNWVFGADGIADSVVCGMVAIHVDGNGQAWISGISPAAIEGALRPYQSAVFNFDSGSAPTDDGGATPMVTLNKTGAAPCYPFDATINATIVGGTMTAINWAT